MTHKAISADGIELKKGDKVWHIYHPNRFNYVSCVVDDNFIWLNNENNEYSCVGNSINYAFDEKFALNNAIKNGNQNIFEEKQKLTKLENYYGKFQLRLTLLDL